MAYTPNMLWTHTFSFIKTPEKGEKNAHTGRGIGRDTVSLKFVKIANALKAELISIVK